MDSSIIKRIRKDKQIKKFSAYGFLKNLSFFKPYLVVYLMSANLDFYQLGILFSIREITKYLFEIPSGIIADNYGRKKELYICFLFYIISFITFFFSHTFLYFALAMILFGLGEAFRSGTHKAMILSYLDKENLKDYKVAVYGRTRSFSLLGTAISSILSILIVIYMPSINFIFIFTILPYIANLILIMTYPSYLDIPNKTKNKSLFTNFTKDFLKKLLKNKKAQKILINQSVFTAIFKSTKDMVQPLLTGIVLTSGVFIINTKDFDSKKKIVLAIFYFIVSVISSFASRNIYRFRKIMSAKLFMSLSFLFLGLSILILSFTTNIMIFIIIIFLIINILADLRKPIYVTALDNVITSDIRASIMSTESQLSAIFTAILAPIFGYIADNIGLNKAFLYTSLFIFLIYSILIFIRNKKNN